MTAGQLRLPWNRRTSSADLAGGAVSTAGARSVFDLSLTKILVLGIIGLVIFGPEQLPKMAAQAGRALRDLRKLADKARSDLSASLGPEYSDFDLRDLNPKAFVRKHLLDDVDEDLKQWRESAAGSDLVTDSMESYLDRVDFSLLPGETPPYDTEAT
jgi:sec-independent protein translocase protein TatB